MPTKGGVNDQTNRALAERGIVVSHTTVMRWVLHCVPEYERRWARFAKRTDSSRRMDENAVSVRSGLHYLYQAVDKNGRAVVRAASGWRHGKRWRPTARGYRARSTSTGMPRAIARSDYLLEKILDGDRSSFAVADI